MLLWRDYIFIDRDTNNKSKPKFKKERKKERGNEVGPL